MTPEALARLHARAFGTDARGWSADEFASLLAAEGTLLCHAPQGFALTRVTLDEAELLTLATDPDHRRKGIAARLLGEVERRAHARGALRHLLEVARDNAPARALYAAMGYAEIGLRRGYYARPGGPATDALLLSKALHAD